MPPKSNHTPMEMPVLKENYLELLLSSAPFSTLLKEEEKEQLARMAVQKYEEKQADLRFGNQSKRISLLLCAQMMNARISIDYKLRMRSKEYAEQFTEITSTEEMENFYQFIKTLLP